MSNSPSSFGHRWLQALVACLLALGCLGVHAQPLNITKGELSLLPEYCPDTQTISTVDPRGSPAAARWVAVLGQAFWGLHHYCWGLVHVARAGQPGMSGQLRRWHYESAINDYRYVLANAQPDFVLAPEVFLRIGEAYVELLDYGNAREAFERSRKLKPDYWPPYVRWASILLRLGKKADALAHLELGLRQMPTEKALIGAYERMGGNFAKFSKTLAAMPAPAPAPAAAASGAAAAEATPGGASTAEQTK